MRPLTRLFFVCALAACEATITKPVGVTPTGPDDTPPAPDACEGIVSAPGAWPLQRLTSRQLQRTVTRVLGDDTHAYDLRLAATDEVLDARLRYALAVSANPVVAEGLVLAAEDVSIAAVSRFPCSGADPRACASDLATRLGRLLWRRTLTSAEVNRLLADYDATRIEGGSYAEGASSVLHGLLAAPDFFFLQQPGGESGAAPRLTGTRLAERLAFTLWHEGPDAELLDAAEAGMLDTPAGLDAALDRLLADPRATEAFGDFLVHWLSPEKATTVNVALAPATRHPGLYPAFRAPGAVGGDGEAFGAALSTFLSRAGRPDTGTFTSLLTSDELVVNEAVARNLDLPAPASGATEVRKSETARRRGVLGQPGVLTALGRFEASDPVHRGVFLLRHAMCFPLPSPDANVNTTLPELGGELKTTRDRFTAPTQAAACAGCHALINPLGFSFENFDAVGKYRETENGAPVDATATLPITVDGKKVAVDGLGELADVLARDPDVRECLAKQFASWALHRTLTPAEACAVRDSTKAFTTGDGAFKDLVRGVVTASSFNAPVLP
ncbi:MAG: DUF1588 domain-containing protein [Myxococcaceae bacterium]|nr:DUF1588 domain-containing protein [Myxococcaceae bacterium]